MSSTKYRTIAREGDESFNAMRSRNKKPDEIDVKMLFVTTYDAHLAVTYAKGRQSAEVCYEHKTPRLCHGEASPQRLQRLPW